MALAWRAPKDPDETLDYGIDWATPLDGAALGDDTIASSQWSVTPAGLTLGTNSFTDTVTRVRTSGGALGTSYLLTNVITTASGQIRERTVKLKMKEK